MAQYVRLEKQEEQQVKKYPTSFTAIKNVRGGLHFALEPYDFSAPARPIAFKWNQEKQQIPTKWALGVFVSQNALKVMEKGYFTFENLEELIEMAESEGYGLYVPDSIKSPKIMIKDMRQTLARNDIDAIKKLMIGASKQNIADFVSEARKLINKLTVSTVSYIERTYKVSLAEIKINE